jgi:hypothetical protein
VGEQSAIVEESVWQGVNQRLAKEQAGSCGPAGSAKEVQFRNRQRRQALVAEPTERVPRVTRLLALALRFEELIRSGVADNYAALAQLGQISRSRVTQMTSMLGLAPDIQEQILFLRVEEAKRLRISEPSVRKLSAILDWGKQRSHWRKLRPPV